ncbi:MAG TPA: multicopper oxidase family protein [Bordetella sp.]
MKRRAFLVHTLAGGALLLARPASAQPAGHAMHGMSGMQGMEGMEGMAPAPATAAKLAADGALPAGAPLAALPALANESRQPGLFRATLAAQPARQALMQGKATLMWQYAARAGGRPAGIAGPLIDAREGDTLEIRFENHLPQPSTIHWHGLPVPPEQDGNPADAVAPGAARTYRYTLPPGSAGTYWYHPHPHMRTAEQVFRGLAGPIIVRAADDPLAGWPERHLFISDLRLAADGSIPANDMNDWINGREGQFVLINGALRPEIAINGDERWRVWNACSARYLKLAFSDGRAFTQVGTDGGLLERPVEGLKELLLAPGERAELIVRAGGQASQAALMALAYDRGKMNMVGDLPPETGRTLAQVTFAPAAGDTARPLPATLRAIAPLGAPAAKKTVMLTEQMDMQQDMHATNLQGMPDGMRFLINGASFDPQRVNLTSRRDQVEVWTLQNFTDMDHPFHIHGTQFQVLDRRHEGATTAEPCLAWRDTVNLRPSETVRIATVQRSAGQRMFHCHILEHEDLGMMGLLQVV